MKIGDSLNLKNESDIYQATLSVGDVYLSKFEEIDHPKFFIIAGLSQDKVFICSVYINSNIPKSFFTERKQSLLNLQVPIKGNKYKFLDYDSFVSCDSQLKLNFSDIYKRIKDKNCKYVGSLDAEDLSNVRNTLISSGLLSNKELKLYFEDFM